MTFRNGISVCPCTRPESFAEIRWGLASAGLVVAELGNLFTFRAQPKKRDVTVLVEEVFSREKKKTRSNNQYIRNPE